MPPPELEPAIPESERPQTRASDRVATVIDTVSNTGAVPNSVPRSTAGISLSLRLPSELTQFSHSNYIALHRVPPPPLLLLIPG